MPDISLTSHSFVPMTGRFASAGDHAVCRAMIETGSRSFFAASKLLPKKVMEPSFALYSFCRLADDTVDVIGGRGNAIRQLRSRLDRIYAGNPMALAPDRAFADVVYRYRLPKVLPEALIEGLEWDVEERDYETIDDLCDYCVRVAGTVGAMMSCIMGVHDPQALARACDLGVAMQLTNIARDVGEDARAGRLYLPKAWLREVGIDPQLWLASPQADPALRSVVRRILDLADRLYRRAEGGIAELPAGCRPAIMAARLIYAEIGNEVRGADCDSLNRRAFVRTSRKVALLARSLLRSVWIDGGRLAPCLPQAVYLVEAAVEAGQGRPGRDWDEQFAWVVDLFTRLEERDRTQRGASEKVLAMSNA